MEQSNSIENLAKAMVEVQKTDLFALKGSNNPFFNSKYADLSSVWCAARKPLTENGLCVIQTNRASGNGCIIVVTTLMHESGEWIRGELELTPDKNTPQGAGSAVTYGRRYGLQSIVGICPEDDDGNAAEGLTNTPRKLPPAKKNPTPIAGPLMTTDQKNQLLKLLVDAGKKKAGDKLTVRDAKEWGVCGATENSAKAALEELNKRFAEESTNAD